jgi:hypothetical protein
MLYQVDDLLELNVNLRCQKVKHVAVQLLTLPYTAFSVDRLNCVISQHSQTFTSRSNCTGVAVVGIKSRDLIPIRS